ncbi:MAG TPA: hypothetical protein DF613_13220 [Lachnospiraceae bacterium]|nr:hypothetical protein [Lachnospiraceae bacterium]
MTKLKFGEDFRSPLTEGCRKLWQMVAPLYGPGGKSVWFEPPHDIPMAAGSIKDILPDFTLADPMEMMGVRILGDAAGRVGRSVGCGVGTTVLLAQALLDSGAHMVAAGVNPVLLRQGADRAVEAVVGHIRGHAFGAGDEAVVKNALRTAATDEAAIHALMEAFGRVGYDGIVTVEDSQLMETEVEAGGIRYEYGYASPGFADDPVRKTVTLKQPYILLIDQKLESITELQKLLLEVIEKDAELLIVAREYSRTFLTDILRNVSQKVFRVVAAMAPGHGESRRRNMEALALRCGGVLQTKEKGCILERCGLEVCGRAALAETGKEYTKISGAACRDLSGLDAMGKRITAELELAETPEQKESCQLALAILAGDSAVIRAGGTTEIEMFACKRDMENALLAARSVWHHGAADGGGIGYLEAAHAAEELLSDMDPEMALGVRCVVGALGVPAKCIADNAGENGAAVVARIQARGMPGYGFDAGRKCFCSVARAGIVDPAEALCAALEAGASAALTILTAAAAVVLRRGSCAPGALQCMNLQVPGAYRHIEGGKMNAVIVSCNTLRDELTSALEKCRCPYPVRYLEASLHNVPKKLHAALQAELDRLEDVDYVLLAFGTCGDALCNIHTGDYTTVLPRVDDCITLLLGSAENRKQYPENMATYFLSRGWLRGERNIWVEYQYTMEKFGKEVGESVFGALFGHYRNLGVLDTGCYPIEEIRDETEHIANVLHLQHRVVPASNQYLRELVSGQWPEERFFVFPPHTEMTSEMLHPGLL